MSRLNKYLDKMRKGVGGLTLRRKKPLEEDGDIPASWRASNRDGGGVPSMESMGVVKSKRLVVNLNVPRTLHVPGYQRAMRFVAGALFLLNLGYSVISLVLSPGMYLIFIMFFLNAFVMLNYLWRSRAKE